VSAKKMDDKKIDRQKLITDDSYELLPIEIESIVVNAESRVFVVLSDGYNKKAYELNTYEASMLSFFAKYYHENAHIQTVHQAFLKFLKLYKTEIDGIVIESKVGDVIYCSVKFTDSKLNNLFTILSLNDGLILSILSEKEINIVQLVWDNMDSIDDWDYENFIIDNDED
jgi:hypothetical protein